MGLDGAGLAWVGLDGAGLGGFKELAMVGLSREITENYEFGRHTVQQMRPRRHSSKDWLRISIVYMLRTLYFTFGYYQYIV